MTRERVSLRPPPDGDRQLEGFPRYSVDVETPLWRLTSRAHGPWWFSCSKTGRFDLSPPEGTCYLATDAVTAILEVFGPGRGRGLITTEALAERRLLELRMPRAHQLADLTSRRTASFGVTMEVHSLAQYELTQAWASRLHQSGADGVLYFARHDPSPARCVALFGPAGERSSWPSGEERATVEVRLRERLWQECRIRIVDRPRSDQISILE